MLYQQNPSLPASSSTHTILEASKTNPLLVPECLPSELIAFAAVRDSASEEFSKGRYSACVDLLKPWEKRLYGESSSIIECRIQLYLSLGAALQNLDQTEEAEGANINALSCCSKLKRLHEKIHPASQTILPLNFGITLKAQGKIEQALESLDRAIQGCYRGKPQLLGIIALAEYQRGTCYLALNEKIPDADRRAHRAFMKALRIIDQKVSVLPGTESSAAYQLGYIAMKEGRLTRAAEWFQRAIESGERDFGQNASFLISSRYSFAIVNAYLGKFSEARLQAAAIVTSCDVNGKENENVRSLILGLIAVCCAAEGDTDRGAAVLAEALGKLEESGSADDRELFALIYGIADSITTRGFKEQADNILSLLKAGDDSPIDGEEAADD